MRPQWTVDLDHRNPFRAPPHVNPASDDAPLGYERRRWRITADTADEAVQRAYEHVRARRAERERSS